MSEIAEGADNDVDTNPGQSRSRTGAACAPTPPQNPLMQLTQAATRLESAVEAQLRLGDPELASLGGDLLEVLRPAVRQTLMEVAEMAALEVSGQLPGQRIEVRLIDGDPELRVTTDDSTVPPRSDDDSIDTEARITVRLPGYLKDLIAEAAVDSGDSVNSYVVETLQTKTHQKPPTTRVRRTIDL